MPWPILGPILGAMRPGRPSARAPDASLHPMGRPEDIVPSLGHEAALQRERSLASLRRIVARDALDATEAMRGVVLELSDYIESTVGDAVREHAERRELLEVAKALLLEPGRMMSNSVETIDRDHPPPGFDPIIAARGAPILVWQWQAYRAIRRFDHGVALSVDNLVGHLHNALKTGFDVRGRSAVDSYAFAISQVWAQGQQAYETERELILGSPQASQVATPAVALHKLLQAELARPATIVRTRTSWLRVAIIVLFALDPEFDGTTVGLAAPIGWHASADGNIFSGRECIVAMFVVPDHQLHQRLLVLIERLVVNLETPPTGNASRRVDSGPAKPAPPRLSRRARRFLILLVERAAHEPIPGPALVALYVSRWSDDRGLTDETLRGSIVPVLKERAALHSEGKVGYWLPEDAAARTWALSGT